MSANNQNQSSFKGRDYIGIHFRCCHVYGRIYKNKEGTMYKGMCPKCMKRVQAKVGNNGSGTDQRIFQAH